MELLFPLLMAQASGGGEILPQKAPLIFGASVSNDYGAYSPGRLLAEMLGAKPNVIAKTGDPGSTSRLLPSLTDESLKRASSMIALDPAFWDTWRSDCSIGVNAVNELVGRANKAGVPLFLGNVPQIDVNWITRLGAGAETGRQGCAPQVNEAIAKSCTPAMGCTLIDLASTYQQIRDADGMDIGGERYSFEELMPDSLHPSAVLSRHMARQLYEMGAR